MDQQYRVAAPLIAIAQQNAVGLEILVKGRRLYTDSLRAGNSRNDVIFEYRKIFRFQATSGQAPTSSTETSRRNVLRIRAQRQARDVGEIQ